MAADHSSDDLDQLLDSALDDFSSLDLSSSATSSSSPPAKGLGLGFGLPELGVKKKNKGKQQQQQRRKAPATGSQAASEALEELRRQTREAVRGIESAAASAPPSPSGGEGDAMVEEFVKQFEELAGSQDMESIVETMMHQLLSKEILHEPMKEIGERYPKWLEEHKSEIKQEEYDRYYRQYELIVKLNEVYEHDAENFPKIVDLMQKMQECGQPPSDIVQELAPDLDLSQLGGQLSPELLQSPSNCRIMRSTERESDPMVIAGDPLSIFTHLHNSSFQRQIK